MNQIAVSERHVLDHLAIQQGLVGIRQVENPVVSILLLDSRMRPRDGRVVENEVIAGETPYGQALGFDDDRIRVQIIADDDEFVHKSVVGDWWLVVSRLPSGRCF